MELIQFIERHPVAFGTGAALLGAIVAGLTGLATAAITAIGHIVFRYFFVRKQFTNESSANTVLLYLAKYAKSFGVSDEAYSAQDVHVRTEERLRQVFFRQSHSQLQALSIWMAPDLGHPE
jgi:hypothetical protein